MTFLIGCAFIATTNIHAGPPKKDKAEDKVEEAQSISFTDIYNNILVTNCARSSCHDGNFEPNFTTIHAAYYTTVMHYMIKNSKTEQFVYRIKPYEPSESLMIERLTNCCMNNESDRMPLLMPPLSEGQIDSIRSWVASGAPDPFGGYPYQPFIAPW